MTIQEGMLWLDEYLDSVNTGLAELFPTSGKTPLESACGDALATGGKRVRATLALLWCEIFSRDYRPALPLAMAYELAHASALVQDDIIDRSNMRRGTTSIVAKYGLPTAILASDLLLFNVPKMVASYGYLDSNRLAKVFDLVGEACRATTWGEFLDLEMALDGEGGPNDYEEMIRLKTSTLLSAPCQSGALIGGSSDEEATLASRFGEAIGMAYQVQDDALDLVGDESALGKPVLNDLRGGKRSIVMMHCYQRCSDNERTFLKSLLNRSDSYDNREVTRLKELLAEKGSLNYAAGMVSRFTADAKEVLSSFPQNIARNRLLELSDYLAARYY
jgi:geranylgeranyl pyrophosphate synthase